MLDLEKVLHQAQLEAQNQKFLTNEEKQRVQNQRNEIKEKEKAIETLMADLQIAEGSKYEALSGVQKEIKELKEVHANTTSLYQSQIEMLKEKIQPSNKKEEIGSLVQRDAIIK